MTSERNSAADVILHIGAGSFHRAHQAWYLHRLIDSGDTRWSLTVGNIRGDMNAVLEALAAQDGASLDHIVVFANNCTDNTETVAKAVGMPVYWHNRAGLPPRDDARPDFLEKSLEPLAGLF